jgi:hypothetical protein
MVRSQRAVGDEFLGRPAGSLGDPAADGRLIFLVSPDEPVALDRVFPATAAEQVQRARLEFRPVCGLVGVIAMK